MLCFCPVDRKRAFGEWVLPKLGEQGRGGTSLHPLTQHAGVCLTTARAGTVPNLCSSSSPSGGPVALCTAVVTTAYEVLREMARALCSDSAGETWEQGRVKLMYLGAISSCCSLAMKEETASLD